MCSEKNRTIILYEIPGKIDFDGIDHNSDEPSLDNLSTTDKTHLTVKEKVFKQLKGSGIVCQLLKKGREKCFRFYVSEILNQILNFTMKIIQKKMCVCLINIINFFFNLS